MSIYAKGMLRSLGSTPMVYCRQYRTDIATRVAIFLTAVKGSLTELGVDASRLTRITAEVTSASQQYLQ